METVITADLLANIERDADKKVSKNREGEAPLFWEPNGQD